MRSNRANAKKIRSKNLGELHENITVHRCRHRSSGTNSRDNSKDAQGNATVATTKIVFQTMLVAIVMTAAACCIYECGIIGW